MGILGKYTKTMLVNGVGEELHLMVKMWEGLGKATTIKVIAYPMPNAMAWIVTLVS